jgi:citrate synthase
MGLAESSGNDIEWRNVRNLSKAAAEALQDLPNLDFGLAAVTRTYRLPDRAPTLLFALGRTTGWMAQAIEEYASNQLIRPRARYTGPVPAIIAPRGPAGSSRPASAD